jgi:uncharacterized protein YndB with AHSA1/START domain
MTLDVRQAVEVEAPPDRIWELLADPAELPRWVWGFFLDNLERYVTGPRRL